MKNRINDTNSEYLKKSITSVIIFFVSAFLIFLWEGFKADAFLIDDNVTQWYPVMKKAYDTFFETGRFVYYDFYELKGFSFLGQGYYGIYNPLMLVSYMISEFTPLSTNCIAVFISICFSLGNVFMYALMKELKCSDFCSVLSVIAISSCATFIYFGYWYYVFGNYLIIPLLIYTVLKFRGEKAEYFAVGIILALDILIGNAQYTCFHYMLYCIICVVLMLFSDTKRTLKVWFSNVIIGIVTVIPAYYMLLDVSDGFAEDQFMFFPLPMYEYLMNTIVPRATFSHFGFCISSLIPYFDIGGSGGRRIFTYAGALTLPVVALILYCIAELFVKGFVKLVLLLEAIITKTYNKSPLLDRINDKWTKVVSRIKQRFSGNILQKLKKTSYEVSVVVSLLIALIFFSLHMSGSFVAVILSKFPVVKNFRYLYKGIFVFLPLLAVVLFYALSKLKFRFKLVVFFVSIIFSVVGIVNNYFVLDLAHNIFFDPNSVENVDYDSKCEISYNLIDDLDLDLKNYRSIAVWQKELITEEVFNYRLNLSRNYPTYIEVFSLGAYEIAVDEERMKQYDCILCYESSFNRYTNGVCTCIFDKAEENPEKFAQQLKVNSVKYFLYEKENSEIYGEYECHPVQEFVDILNSLPNITVERVEDFEVAYALIEISGVDSICSDDNGESIKFNDDSMDLLSFEAGESSQYRFTMAYDEKLCAYYFDESGKKVQLETEPDETGNTLIKTENISGKTVYLSYHDTVCVLCFVAEAITAVLFAALIVYLFIIRRKTENSKD